MAPHGFEANSTACIVNGKLTAAAAPLSALDSTSAAAAASSSLLLALLEDEDEDEEEEDEEDDEAVLVDADDDLLLLLLLLAASAAARLHLLPLPVLAPSFFVEGGFGTLPSLPVVVAAAAALPTASLSEGHVVPICSSKLGGWSESGARRGGGARA